MSIVRGVIKIRGAKAACLKQCFHTPYFSRMNILFLIILQSGLQEVFVFSYVFIV